jgi:hypothetical protein
MYPLLRYPRVRQVICTLGALSERVGNHQLLPSLLPLRSKPILPTTKIRFWFRR